MKPMLAVLYMSVLFIAFVLWTSSSAYTGTSTTPTEVVATTQTGTSATPSEVTATTWSWAKLVGEPVRVVLPDPSAQNLGLMQIKFQMSDAETLTAFVNVMAVSGWIAPTGAHWKIGDEVLIARIPCSTSTGPNSTYFVLNWRKKQE